MKKENKKPVKLKAKKTSLSGVTLKDSVIIFY